jgi:hypothetical protein
MTVKELMDQLATMPQDALIAVDDHIDMHIIEEVDCFKWDDSVYVRIITECPPSCPTHADDSEDDTL